MNSIDDIKAAIERLAPEDRARLKAWLDGVVPAEPQPDATEQAAKLGRLAGKAFVNFRKGFSGKS